MACRGVANQASPLVTPRQEAKMACRGVAKGEDRSEATPQL